jgi:hypothetical protein
MTADEVKGTDIEVGTVTDTNIVATLDNITYPIPTISTPPITNVISLFFDEYVFKLFNIPT